MQATQWKPTEGQNQEEPISLCNKIQLYCNNNNNALKGLSQGLTK